jgi:hypothetical protein
MKIKTFRQQYFDIDPNLKVYVPKFQGTQYNLGFPDLVEIWEFNHDTHEFILNDRENIDHQLITIKKFLSEISMKEIFYYSIHDWQTIFVKAIKC